MHRNIILSYLLILLKNKSHSNIQGFLCVAVANDFAIRDVINKKFRIQKKNEAISKMIDSWEIRTQDREEGSGRFPSMISVLWLGVWDNVANDAQEGLFFFFYPWQPILWPKKGQTSDWNCCALVRWSKNPARLSVQHSQSLSVSADHHKYIARTSS